MELKLKRTAESILKARFPKRFERILNPHILEDIYAETKGLFFSICEDSNRESEKYLIVRIRWHIEDEERQVFPCTKEGIRQACEWLDEKRIERISEML